MNAFQRARTAFGFEYLISFSAELRAADRDITGIEGLLFRIRLNRGEKIVSKIQSWRNKLTPFLKLSRKLAELVDRKLEMAPNRMFQQLTDKTKTKKTRNFQKFLSDDGNESLQYNPPLPPSLDSTYKDP